MSKLKSPRLPQPSPEGTRCKVSLNRERTGEQHFGVTIVCKRGDGQNFTLSDEGEYRKNVADGLPPGQYEILIRASRSGFPQFGIVSITDAAGKIVEQYPPTYALSYSPTVTLNAEERLSINILPAVRPYNSVFFRIGEGAQAAQCALVIPRPYPSQDFETHRGTELFNAFPLHIAFSGRKRALEHPEEIQQIQHMLPSEPFVREHPEWTLGCREVARRLAAEFAQKRAEHPEDVRGQDQLSFLNRRTAEGKLSTSLQEISQADLASIFLHQLIQMEAHNVHRINEGGGYHNRSFRQDLQEAEEKMRVWPGICFSATEMERKAYADPGASKEKRQQVRERLLYALHRELRVLEEYPLEWLEKPSEPRMEELKEILHNLEKEKIN
ncbi:MAG: carboxypeptidase-like regulatory domain-containing protein [Patescibacteria group bacterium]